MKILLVGEYSRLHNSLKEGLQALGHEAVIVATGDNFKNYDVDYSIAPLFFTKYLLPRKCKNAFYLLTGIDLEKTEKGLRFYFLLPKLKGFDHVQLINSDALETHPRFEKWLYQKLLRQNKKMSLLVCGDETPVIDYLLKNELQPNILTPFFENPTLKNTYKYPLKYTKRNYRRLFDYVKANASVLVTSDLDYKIPMERMGYEVTHIPNPINTEKIRATAVSQRGKIVIFLGINRLSYIKKGIPYFEEALEIVKEKYPDKVKVIIAENTPYARYKKLYEEAHILLDYTYGLDQGYNALEAMAAGKVVFTGAGAEFMAYYGLNDRVAIHAVPDAQAIANDLGALIDNPEEIVAISQRARAFIEKEHHYIAIAQQYLEAWQI
ncbi:glycosyl transferase family 1 [Flavobacterium cyanobacteriorum]|uniref:Glycosyl transferase family 1 n=1 Tax=Flavobacterium cyanobacteriorum TaxID=2022802 RepID=A0A255YUZ8_9FLAO|nr:glycosyltransferase [Flavobacterium cyanobacteriorum]OYQ33038.1 glycosyl transferase family 1 [Flavobacterium cyanobacteriorum]